MSVSELREQLDKFPPDKEVMYMTTTNDGNMFKLEEIVWCDIVTTPMGERHVVLACGYEEDDDDEDSDDN